MQPRVLWLAMDCCKTSNLVDIIQVHELLCLEAHILMVAALRAIIAVLRAATSFYAQ